MVYFHDTPHLDSVPHAALARALGAESAAAARAADRARPPAAAPRGERGRGLAVLRHRGHRGHGRQRRHGGGGGVGSVLVTATLPPRHTLTSEVDFHEKCVCSLGFRKVKLLCQQSLFAIPSLYVNDVK